MILTKLYSKHQISKIRSCVDSCFKVHPLPDKISDHKLPLEIFRHRLHPYAIHHLTARCFMVDVGAFYLPDCVKQSGLGQVTYCRQVE